MNIESYIKAGDKKSSYVSFPRIGRFLRNGIGVFPCGISYADRHHEEHRDYKSLAFLPYSSLVLEFRKDCPTELRGEIIASAAAIQARKGEQYQISGCGQTVLLGGEKRA